ncbi:MAG: hypothetical protein B6D65_03840 [candidate division Zixibacteria bacterium 4484_93]|nr:MAG: hypothetical protein B6D65_03840 [candidate division Zixibacteria bacterium 4484_93]
MKKAIILLPFIIILIASCTVKQQKPAAKVASKINPTIWSEVKDSILFQLSVDKTAIVIGDTIHTRFVMKNVSGSERSLLFSSTKYVDFFVADERTLVWVAFKGKGFLQVIKEVPLASGDSLFFEFNWAGESMTGGHPILGEYYIFAEAYLVSGLIRTGRIPVYIID